jgi:hypothetical protein
LKYKTVNCWYDGVYRNKCPKLKDHVLGFFDGIVPCHEFRKGVHHGRSLFANHQPAPLLKIQETLKAQRDHGAVITQASVQEDMRHIIVHECREELDRLTLSPA